jgi:hypothetical protein
VTTALTTDDLHDTMSTLPSEFRRITSPNPPTRFPYISPPSEVAESRALRSESCSHLRPLCCTVCRATLLYDSSDCCHVTVRPLIKVSNQLVAAPVGSNVDIGCDVEASPKAMNSWFRDSGKTTLLPEYTK